jgi:hypothetical protein
MERRRLALAALVCGIGVVVAAQRLAPIAGPPLYDGVVVEDPYKWLSPPAGFSGGAQSATDSGAVQGDKNPDLSVFTPEQPPQAQVFAGQGYLVMPPGTTTIKVSIKPVPATAQPSDGVIAGNVYRFSLTNQNGAALSGSSGGGVTIVLRGPPNLPSATIERLAGGDWTPLQTDPAGTPHMFAAVVTDFGDFAIVAPPDWVPAREGSSGSGAAGPAGPGASAASASASGAPGSSAAGSSGSGPPLAAIVGIAFALAVIIGVGVLLARRSTPPAPPTSPTSSRTPRSRPPVKADRGRPPRRRR